MNLRQVYSRLLRLYPSDYRVVFAAEMLAVMEGVVEEGRGNRSGSARLVLRELSGLLAGAAREWLAKAAYSVHHSNSYITGRGLPDRLLMRPAGVAWETFYTARASPGKGIRLAGGGGARLLTQSEPEQAGSLRPQECLNAHQRFEAGSSLRRLLMLLVGDSCQCTRGADSQGLNGSHEYKSRKSESV